MMMNEYFFDTNILIYAVSSDEKKARPSKALIARGGTISVQVLNEFVAVTRRKHKASWHDVFDSLAALRSTLHIVALTVETHESGVTLAERHGIAIYDAMIVAAAQLAGCATLYSEDMQTGRTIGGVRIVNPYCI